MVLSTPRLVARVVLVTMVALASSGCAHLFFFPDRDMRLAPDELGLEYRDVFFESADGVRLHGWLLPAHSGNGASLGTVVFLHGNAQNISAHIASVFWMPARGFDVFLFDYRGYGRSAGKPSIAAVHRDAEAALRYAASLHPDGDGHIVVFGQSLGGAIAPSVVAEVHDEIAVRALVLDSAFSDFRGIAREKLAALWLTWPLQVPLALTVPTEFSPVSSLADLRDVPVVIVHGEMDDIIPVAHAHLLERAAGENAELWLVPGAGHIASFQQPELRDRLITFLQATLT